MILWKQPVREKSGCWTVMAISTRSTGSLFDSLKFSSYSTGSSDSTGQGSSDSTDSTISTDSTVATLKGSL